MIDIFD